MTVLIITLSMAIIMVVIVMSRRGTLPHRLKVAALSIMVAAVTMGAGKFKHKPHGCYKPAPKDYHQKRFDGKRRTDAPISSSTRIMKRQVDADVEHREMEGKINCYFEMPNP